MDFIYDKAAIEEMLGQSEWGTMAAAVDGQPCIVPLNYAYVHGRIVFHGALKGRKLEAIAANPRVCFCVCGQEGTVQDHAGEEACHLDHWSVLVFGQARLVTENKLKAQLANAFNRAFNPEAAGISLDEQGDGGGLSRVQRRSPPKPIHPEFGSVLRALHGPGTPGIRWTNRQGAVKSSALVSVERRRSWYGFFSLF